MSEQQEDNTCTTCGGAKLVRYAIDPVKHKVVPIPVSAPLKICMCPLPKPQHDGKLDSYDDFLRHAECHLSDRGVVIDAPIIDHNSEEVLLDASQALSLLDYLKQNQAKLEELARAE